MIVGPLQLVVINFVELPFPAGVVDHLRTLRSQGVIRMVDGVIVAKDSDGDMAFVEVPTLIDEKSDLVGLLASSLFAHGKTGRMEAVADSGFLSGSPGEFGLTEDQLLEVADLIPMSSKVLFLLLEHLWALDLKEFVAGTDGTVLANGWITPASLIGLDRRASDRFDFNGYLRARQ